MRAYTPFFTAAGVFTFGPPNGIFNFTEGDLLLQQIFGTGFTYGGVPIRVTTFTYDQFASRGYDLLSFFNANDVPSDAADGMLYQLVLWVGTLL